MQDLKLEVVFVPVSDLDRAKRFYEGLGWRLDADLILGDGSRGIQFTPPGSACSIHLRQRTADGGPWGRMLVVSDIVAARAELADHGAAVGEVFHVPPPGRTGGPQPGRDLEGGSYVSFASFSDPDRNDWLLQEVTARLPGRGFGLDAASLIALLRETEERHGQYEATAPTHHWSEWYGGYMAARINGRTADDAAADAKRRVEGRAAAEPARVTTA